MDVFGHTRSHMARNYALITPDTHVESPLLGWEKATAVVHISPHLGARFLQFTAHLEAGGSGIRPQPGVERFLYVLSGNICITTADAANSRQNELDEGGYAFLPVDHPHTIASRHGAKLLVFEKRAVLEGGLRHPEPLIGHAKDIMGEPFQDDPDARLQTLLPIEPEFDMAVNIFTYQPGATLPQVEIHVMEHGLMMLDGMGVYRLADDYYPVTAGDVIWMASFCPQWFVAMGKRPASYIYYKDIHRDQHCLDTRA